MFNTPQFLLQPEDDTDAHIHIVSADRSSLHEPHALCTVFAVGEQP